MNYDAPAPNALPEAAATYSLVFQVICFLICAPLLVRLAFFSYKVVVCARRDSKSLVWPALSMGYVVLATFLIVTNVYFLPNFSSCVLSILPPLSPSMVIFVYLTHSAVISAFVINYANSVATFQELEHGRYGGDLEWGALIRETSPFVQTLDSVARLMIGITFVWLENSLWRVGRIDLGDFGSDPTGESNNVDPFEYRIMLADIADSGFSVYVCIMIWTMITVVALVFGQGTHFRSKRSRNLLLRQTGIIVCGVAVSAYALYIARGSLSLFPRYEELLEVDRDWVVASAFFAAFVGLVLIGLVAWRVVNLIKNKELFAQEVR